MKRRRTQRPEPRTAHLIGLNLTDDDLAQLDRLFETLKTRSPRQRNSTVLHEAELPINASKLASITDSPASPLLGRTTTHAHPTTPTRAQNAMPNSSASTSLAIELVFAAKTQGSRVTEISGSLGRISLIDIRFSLHKEDPHPWQPILIKFAV